ncbi:hypothetical protein M8J76_006545 [Diaphorina citri]|nr:hypothetical protein M8J76_006545 [Diaphorina citri]
MLNPLGNVELTFLRPTTQAPTIGKTQLGVAGLKHKFCQTNVSSTAHPDTPYQIGNFEHPVEWPGYHQKPVLQRVLEVSSNE